MAQLQGEGLKVGFDSSLRLEFHGSKVTSDAGLIPYRELDGVLGLFGSVSEDLSDVRTGRNTQHALETLLRQSVYSRLPSNDVLQRLIQHLLTRPVSRPPLKPIVLYDDFKYQAASWDKPRRVVAKVE